MEYFLQNYGVVIFYLMYSIVPGVVVGLLLWSVSEMIDSSIDLKNALEDALNLTRKTKGTTLNEVVTEILEKYAFNDVKFTIWSPLLKLNREIKDLAELILKEEDVNFSSKYKVVGNKIVRGSHSFDVHLRTVVGSTAYKTNVEGSDIDLKGVFVQPLSHRLLYGEIREIRIDADTTYYEMSKFLSLISIGNPTMLELIFMPERCIEYISPKFKKIFYTEKTQRGFLTMHCRNSFCGYAYEQIKKASGLDKLMNWEKEGRFTTPKDVLDFCYIPKGGRTSSVRDYLGTLVGSEMDQENYGLAKMNHVKGGYFAYYFDPESDKEIPRGMCKDNSNDMRTSSIPKNKEVRFEVHFNLSGYKEHAKNYQRYLTWVKNRNTQRYVDSSKHGQKVDGKNLLHCRRLIEMGKEIAEGKLLKIERDNYKELISIRRGEVDLKSLLSTSEADLREVEDLFRGSKLPSNVKPSLIRSIKTKFYL